MMAVKYSKEANSSLIATNIVLMGIALILITLGGIAHSSFRVYNEVLPDYLRVLAVLIIILGILFLFASLFGFMSTVYERRLLFKINIGILIIIIFLEVAIGTTAFVMLNSLMDGILNGMVTTKSQYLNSSSSFVAWNALQRNFHCCGINSYKDWFEVFHNSSVPDSCCKITSAHCGDWAIGHDNIQKNGCVNYLFLWLHTHELIIGVVCFSLIPIKVIAINVIHHTTRCIEKKTG